MTRARVRLTLLAVASSFLVAGCVYAPLPPTSYQFERHPGVFMEVWSQYDGYTTATSTRLINRGTVNKCAWTDALDSRLLKAGDSWQLSQVQSPGNVVVTNVMPWDPNCVNAKREHGSPGR